MTDLTSKRCLPCEGGVDPLSTGAASSMLEQTPGWSVGNDGQSIERDFSFKNFHQTMALTNAIAYIAHQEDHHPDMNVGYNTLHVVYTTHAIGGLSENDFICAAKINALL